MVYVRLGLRLLTALLALSLLTGTLACNGPQQRGGEPAEEEKEKDKEEDKEKDKEEDKEKDKEKDEEKEKEKEKEDG